MLEFNTALSFPAAPLLTVILALVGELDSVTVTPKQGICISVTVHCITNCRYICTLQIFCDISDLIETAKTVTVTAYPCGEKRKEGKCNQEEGERGKWKMRGGVQREEGENIFHPGANQSRRVIVCRRARN